MKLLTIIGIGLLTIFGNISINGVDVGGLERDAALAKLHHEIPIASEVVRIAVDDVEFVYTFAELGAGYDFETAVDTALAYGREGGFLKKLARQFSLSIVGHDIEAAYSHDSEKVVQIARKIADSASVELREPSYRISGRRFEFEEGRAGRQVCVETLTAGITAVLLDRTGNIVTAEIITSQPTRALADFQAATDLIGSYTTPFDSSNAARATNLTVASGYLNNQVILPDEIFSTCRALRPRTEENGYVTAGQILNGEPDSGVGGGICQISSTLYMAALHAELPIHERRNHSLMVGYMAPATDAAIAQGHIDLKFQNNSSYPMLVESILTGNRHVVNIYGKETRPSERNVSFRGVLVEHRAQEDKIIEDDLMPQGKALIEFPGIPGGRYELHKIVTMGEASEQITVNTSNYRPLQRVVRIGNAPVPQVRERVRLQGQELAEPADPTGVEEAGESFPLR